MEEATARPMMWGVTASSLQAEGAAPAADWSRWERDGRVPRSGDGNGLATNHPDDFALIASLGLTHVRVGIEWARLEPEPGKPDSDAADRYRDLLRSAQRAGLQVVATLHHQTLPGWYVEDEGGHADETARERRWARYVDVVAETFDELVDVWVPMDDPIGWAVRGYGLGSRPPGRRDPEATLDAADGAIRALLRAWDLLSSGSQPVMAVFGAPTVFGVGPDNESERRRIGQLFLDSWMGLLADGELVLPGRPVRLFEDATGAFDLVGVTHDHPIGVTRTGSDRPLPHRRTCGRHRLRPRGGRVGRADVGGHHGTARSGSSWWPAMALRRQTTSGEKSI